MIYWVKQYFSRLSNHLLSLYEVLTIAVFSLLPFGITFFVASASREEGQLASLSDIVGRGQLFLLAYSIFGTIFWLAFMRSDKPRHDARAFLGVIATLLIFPVVGFIGVDPTFSTILNDNIILLGYWFYGILLFIHYLILFYMNIDPPQPSDVISREASNMRSKYEELRSD